MCLHAFFSRQKSLQTACSLAVAALVSAIALVPAMAEQTRELVISAPWEIKSPDPSLTGYAFTRMGVAETLVEVDEAGQPVPQLARNWTVSPDALLWHFELREDVVFHDGTPMDAASVANALTLALGKPGVLSKAPIEAIAATDKGVDIRLTSPFAPLPAFLAHSSAQILAPSAYGADGAATQMIATGPYEIVTLEPPQKMTMQRFDGYWGQPAKIEKTTYLASSRAETRALMAESGDAHLVFNLDPPSVARLKSKQGLTISSVAIPRVITIKVNGGHPLLSDVNVRQALSLAIDREALSAGVLRAPETAATQLFPVGMGQWHQKDLPSLAFDLEEAQSLLKAVGYEKNASGVFEKDGKELALKLITYPDRPELPLVATALQNQWAALGAKVEVIIGNSSEIPSGHQNGTLELGLVARNFSLVPDPLGTLLQDFGPEGGDWGAMNWHSKDVVDALARLQTGLMEPDDAASDRAKIATILQAELPVIPVAWYLQSTAASSSLEGVRIDPFERTYGVPAMDWAR